MKNCLLFNLVLLAIILTWCNNFWWKEKWTCIDVTSYDYNRNNDMKCTSSKWAVQYTSYEWARILMWK